MKILLDECVPWKVRSVLIGHRVFTVHMMGWTGVKNGELIRLADEQFDVFLTIDKNLAYQQNLKRLRMAIVLLSVPNNKVATILEKTPKVVDLLVQLQPSQFYTV